MPPAARLTDMHVCPMVTPGLPPIPHVGGPVVGPGVPTVLIEKLPAAVVGDNIVGAGVTIRSVGRNTASYVGNAQDGAVSMKGQIFEDFGGGTRSLNEIKAQANAAASGILSDQGGHLGAYRFFPEQGSINMFPQQANFNMSAFKVMENDFARYVKQGYSVDFETTLGNSAAGSGRPSSVIVKYDVNSPSGDLVDAFTAEFENKAGQVYKRRVK